jgi:hypothetical protein
LKKSWYRKKAVMIPVACLLAVVGWEGIVSLLGVKSDEKLNPDYYRDSQQPLFEKK